MPTISTCPKCRQQVTIPAGIASAADVRCPLCAAEYALGEALALAPPELIPVVPVIDEANEAAAAEQSPATAVMVSLRARRSKSAVRTTIEVILGGLAGCLVAYYALALWFRADFDKYLPTFPSLPFISRLTAPPAGDGRAKENPPLEKPADR